MPTAELELASEARRERMLSDEVDARIDLLLANYQRVTANPRSMGYLRFLLKHYARSPTPFRSCVADNMRRFGAGRTEAICATLKDTIRQTTHWRGKGPQPLDHGSPGVAIGEADAGAAQPAWHGGHGLSEHQPCLLDELDAEFGVVDHSEPVLAALAIVAEIGQACDPYRVLIGLDDPPTFAVAA